MFTKKNYESLLTELKLSVDYLFIHLSPCTLHSPDMGVSSRTLSPFNQIDKAENTISQSHLCCQLSF